MNTKCPNGIKCTSASCPDVVQKEKIRSVLVNLAMGVGYDVEKLALVEAIAKQLEVEI